MSSILKNKDFKNKETAFLLCKKMHGNDLSLTEVSVVRVGPKFVTVNDRTYDLKFQEAGCSYLLMADNDWQNSKLFLTKRDAEEYWERKILETKLIQSFRKQIYSMPLTKLRLVQAILENTEKEDAPEITGMMTVSTAHICQDTAETFLNTLCENPEESCLICRKDEYGWTIHLPDPSLKYESTDVGTFLPEDLHRLIRLALDSGCNQLRLDGDGPIVKEIPMYPWDMQEEKK